MMKFDNKVAIITGASGDIGEACATLLHGLGAHVVISGTNLEKLNQLGEKLNTNYTIKQVNLDNQENCVNLINDFNKVDILVCNAGVTKDNLSLRMSNEAFQQVLDINLTANFILNKTAIRKMLKHGFGRIINITSVVAFSGNPGQANYCASKAGLVGMTKSLALEVATKGITINCVAPGFIVSNMTNKLNDSIKSAILSRIPQQKFGLPIDIANAVAFLSSEQSNYITGQTIHVNGGMLMV